jgi:hypothetical protein
MAHDSAAAVDFVSFLPEVVYYYSHDGRDLWCRRPYGFFFSSSELAQKFLARMGSEFDLSLVGIDRGVMMAPLFLDGLRRLQVSRLFIDPEIDEATGDVIGKILRLEEELGSTPRA